MVTSAVKRDVAPFSLKKDDEAVLSFVLDFSGKLEENPNDSIGVFGDVPVHNLQC